MDSLDKIVPQAPQPDTGPDTGPDMEIDRDVIVDAPDDYDRTDMVARNEGPAKDVGGEIGRKTRWNGWQIAGLVAGGVAVAAGIAAVVYMRSRQARPDAQLEKLGRKTGLDRLDIGYGDRIRSGLEEARVQFGKAPHVKTVREKVSALLH